MLVALAASETDVTADVISSARYISGVCRNGLSKLPEMTTSTVNTKPFEGQKPGTSGLRKRFVLVLVLVLPPHHPLE